MPQRKNFIEICRINENAASKELSFKTERLDSVKNELSALEMRHSEDLALLNEEIKDINSTIEKLIKHGSAVPSDITKRRKFLCKK